MPENVRRIWEEFDKLIDEAATAEAKSTLQGLKLLAELLNTRLGPLEHMLGTALTSRATFQQRVT